MTRLDPAHSEHLTHPQRSALHKLMRAERGVARGIHPSTRAALVERGYATEGSMGRLVLTAAGRARYIAWFGSGA